MDLFDVFISCFEEDKQFDSEMNYYDQHKPKHTVVQKAHSFRLNALFLFQFFNFRCKILYLWLYGSCLLYPLWTYKLTSYLINKLLFFFDKSNCTIKCLVDNYTKIGDTMLFWSTIKPGKLMTIWEIPLMTFWTSTPV